MCKLFNWCHHEPDLAGGISFVLDIWRRVVMEVPASPEDGRAPVGEQTSPLFAMTHSVSNWRALTSLGLTLVGLVGWLSRMNRPN